MKIYLLDKARFQESSEELAKGLESVLPADTVNLLERKRPSEDGSQHG